MEPYLIPLEFVLVAIRKGGTISLLSARAYIAGGVPFFAVVRDSAFGPGGREVLLPRFQSWNLA